MNTLKKSLIVVLLGYMLPLSVLAVDKAAGEQAATTCLVCHGAGGKSSNAQIPNLAAQQATYIEIQLKAFKSGQRQNPMMQSAAANLTDAEIENLAAYFFSLPAVKAGGDAALVKTGEEKAGMCLGCHIDAGVGNGQFPRLAGQHPDYLLRQLSNFKDGARKNSHMQAIAGMLSPDDIKALAAYFGSL